MRNKDTSTWKNVFEIQKLLAFCSQGIKWTWDCENGLLTIRKRFHNEQNTPKSNIEFENSVDNRWLAIKQIALYYDINERARCRGVGQ